MIDAIITTAARQQHILESEAIQLAREWDIPYVKRNNRSVDSLFPEYQVTNVAVLDYQANITLHKQDQEPIKYHPGMSTIRIKRLQDGNNDPMVDILNLLPDDTLLDCTLGLASDAIVAQYVASDGQVIGLEADPLVAMFTKKGLQTYQAEQEVMQNAMRKIEVIHADYNQFLADAPDRSYDFVYFDPMFRKTVDESRSMQFLKVHCCNEPVTEQAVRDAMRVARKMVVLKERTYSREFKILGFTPTIRPNSSFSYGIIRLEGLQ